MDTALDEHLGQPLLTVWPCGRQVTNDEVPIQSNKVGDVSGGQGYKVHGVGIFILCDTLVTNPFPIVRI